MRPANIRMSVLMVSVLMICLAAVPAVCDAAQKDDLRGAQKDSVFAPGYINAELYRVRNAAMAAINESQDPDRDVKQTVDNYRKAYLKLADQIDRTNSAAQKVKVVPQAKPAPVSQAPVKAAASKSAKIVIAENMEKGSEESNKDADKHPDTGQANVKIGKGSNQVYESGRLISETLDGKTHIYAGFDSVGTATIGQALARAKSGDVIIVRGGREYSDETRIQTVSKGNYTVGGILISKGVTLKGGYDEKGHRDLDRYESVLKNTVLISAGAEKVVMDGIAVEVAQHSFQWPGLSIINNYEVMVSNSSDVTISNCKVECDTSYGIVTYRSHLTLENSLLEGSGKPGWDTGRLMAVSSGCTVYAYRNTFIFNGSYSPSVAEKGIYCWGSNVTYEQNQFYNKTAQEIRVYMDSNSGGKQLLLKDNNFFGNWGVVSYNSISGAGTITMANNYFESKGTISIPKGKLIFSGDAPDPLKIK